jgi:hypothetical protein
MKKPLQRYMLVVLSIAMNRSKCRGINPSEKQISTPPSKKQSCAQKMPNASFHIDIRLLYSTKPEAVNQSMSQACPSVNI